MPCYKFQKCWCHSLLSVCCEHSLREESLHFHLECQQFQNWNWILSSKNKGHHQWLHGRWALIIISFENLSLKCYTFKTSYRPNNFFHQRKVLSLPKPEASGRRATNLRHIVIGKCIIGMSFLMTFHVTLETILCTESLLTAITGTEERFLPYRQQKPDIRNIQAYIRYC